MGRRRFVRAPEKIVIELFLRRRFKVVDPNPGGIETCAKVFDRAIFAPGIHRLKNEEQAAPMFGVQNFLKLADLFTKLTQLLERFFFIEAARAVGIDPGKFELVSGARGDNWGFHRLNGAFSSLTTNNYQSAAAAMPRGGQKGTKVTN
jgi:hypothetical protein